MTVIYTQFFNADASARIMENYATMMERLEREHMTAPRHNKKPDPYLDARFAEISRWLKT